MTLATRDAGQATEVRVEYDADGAFAGVVFPPPAPAAADAVATPVSLPWANG